MITIKSPREIETMAAAGRVVAATLALVQRQVRPGVSTEELDRLAEGFIRSHPGARPSFKGLYDFPATLCTSINAEVVHGIPSPKRVLRERSEEHTSELQSPCNLVCRLLLEKKKNIST